MQYLHLTVWRLLWMIKDLEMKIKKQKAFKPEPEIIKDASLAQTMISILNYVRELIVHIAFEIFVKAANHAYHKKM